MFGNVWLLVLGVLLLVGCSGEDPNTAKASAAPWVLTVAVEAAGSDQQRYSATVQARRQVPLAFQVGGRVLERRVDAGQVVERGQVLLRLDPRDLQQRLQAAEAERAAASRALELQQRDLQRLRTLQESGAVSLQALELAERATREAEARLRSARAAHQEAGNALGYATLRADEPGVLVELQAEPGQVVAPGAPVAELAVAGAREVEVFLPAGDRAPPRGELLLAGERLPLILREVAGAAEASSRSWRARYRIDAPAAHAALPALGSVVEVLLQPAPLTAGSPAPLMRALRVPLAALDERGQGAQVWQVLEGRATPLAVEVLGLEAEHARIRAPLAIGARVIALGTHLLTPGMAVQERGR